MFSRPLKARLIGLAQALLADRCTGPFWSAMRANLHSTPFNFGMTSGQARRSRPSLLPMTLTVFGRLRPIRRLSPGQVSNCDGPLTISRTIGARGFASHAEGLCQPSADGDAGHGRVRRVLHVSLGRANRRLEPEFTSLLGVDGRLLPQVRAAHVLLGAGSPKAADTGLSRELQSQ